MFIIGLQSRINQVLAKLFCHLLRLYDSLTVKCVMIASALNVTISLLSNKQTRGVYLVYGGLIISEYYFMCIYFRSKFC